MNTHITKILFYFAMKCSTIIKLNIMGYEVTDFGTHSFRKGVASYCAGYIGGPSIIAIFLRAGWSLGQVQDRYLTYSDGGDQLCGRVAAGLDINAGSKFAVLPPHLLDSNVLSESEWQMIVPGYNEYDKGFQGCIPFLLASIVYHYDWLTAKNDDGSFRNISSNHPIHHSRLFTSGIVTRLSTKLIRVITSGRCETTGMRATGIPMHIELAREMELLREENKSLCRLISTTSEQIISGQDRLFSQLPALVTENIIQNIDIQGVHQISRNDLNECMRSMLDQYTQRFQSNNIENASALTSTTAPITDSNTNSPGHKFWTWGGKIRPVPEAWSFPRCKVKTACDLFLFGDKLTEIRPYRLIACCALARKDQQYFCKAEHVFNRIRMKSVELNLVTDACELLAMPVDRWDAIFGVTFTNFITQIEMKRGKLVSKAGDISLVTFYDMLKELT
jgi:hypothetical protein